MQTLNLSVPEERKQTLKRQWKTVILASLGGALEIYDFIIYGVFAKEIAAQFFPSVDQLVSLISAFGVFAIGYISRPLGGILLGSLGDRYGRRVIFIVSIVAMSTATMSIGFLPGYAMVGIFAPLLLIFFRLVQGFFLGGEVACSITYVVEELPERASILTGLVVFCLTSGVLVAALISLAIHTFLPPEESSAYGWRIAFAIGGVLGFLSYFLRQSLDESAEYKRIKEHVAPKPFRMVLTDYPRQVAAGVGITSIANASNTVLFVVLPSYLTGILGYPSNAVSVGQNVGIACMAVSLIACAWLGQRVRPALIHRAGTAAMCLISYPLYAMMVNHELNIALFFICIGTVAGTFNGTYAYLVADLFPTTVRFSGVAFSLNISNIAFAGITPLLITNAIRITGSLASPGLYMSAVAGFSVLVGLLLRGCGGRILSGVALPRATGR